MRAHEAVAFRQRRHHRWPQLGHFDAVTAATVDPSAVVWISGRQAIVAMMSRDHRISTCEITRGWLSQPSYVAQLVRVIGARQRLLIFGPRSMRLALEREYAATYPPADRLIEQEPARAPDLQEVVDRLRTFAG
jgi:hypothetical protein